MSSTDSNSSLKEISKQIEAGRLLKERIERKKEFFFAFVTFFLNILPNHSQLSSGTSTIDALREVHINLIFSQKKNLTGIVGRWWSKKLWEPVPPTEQQLNKQKLSESTVLK